MWTKLEETFEQIGLTYSRQGSFTKEKKLPDSFFTFWNIESSDKSFYDNEVHEIKWDWLVYFYTNDPKILYSKLEEFIKIAKSKGFKVDGKGKDIPSDIPNYSGRYVKLLYVENNTEV